MIAIRDKQIVIDGVPRLIICGEIHYFRLQRSEWLDRIQKLRDAGCNAVASYVPWLCHEPVEGQIDLTGATRPELDFGAFIDLCREHGLLFFVRPGPFILAEMKNEGLPYWLYTKHPESIPVGWDGIPAPSRTLDYFSPGFLQDVRSWYRAVMAVIAPRLQPRGGNIIGVQLDNEIGMLAWVTNSPDFTAGLIADFATWLGARYDAETLTRRYPFDLGDATIREPAVRSPREDYAAELLRDLGHFMRERFARYVATLRGYAEEFGVRDVPFVINIHGTGGGRGLTFPIGISQLYPSYTREPGYISGSDIYFGDLTTGNFQDLYLANAFMDAVHTPDQPPTSVEFECGSADYNETYGTRNDPSAADFKVRLCIAQGNRMLNYYLFAGGRNYRLDRPVDDGNDRIAFTGERHGFAAPVDPEGHLAYTYAPLARVTRTIMAVGDKLATMREEHDAVAVGFIPDYFMTEYRYPASLRMRELVNNLEANRGAGAWETMIRAMLFAGYRFGAINLQDTPLDPAITPVLALGSARYMDDVLQRRLVDYVQAGGGLLLYGEVPLYDMEMRDCTILADALGLRPTGTARASAHYHLSLVAEGWAAPRPEVRTHAAQTFEATRGDILFRVYDSGAACGFDIPLGKGRAHVITTAYICDVPLFRQALERLGARARLRHDYPDYGILLTSSATRDERFLHVLNLDGFDKTFHLIEDERRLLGEEPITLRARTALLLPWNVAFGDVRVVYATAEIQKVEPGALTFRLTQARDQIALETERAIVAAEDYDLTYQGRLTIITSRKHALVDDQLTVRWR
jgi:beta-galactosidase